MSDSITYDGRAKIGVIANERTMKLSVREATYHKKYIFFIKIAVILTGVLFLFQIVSIFSVTMQYAANTLMPVACISQVIAVVIVARISFIHSTAPRQFMLGQLPDGRFLFVKEKIVHNQRRTRATLYTEYITVESIRTVEETAYSPWINIPTVVVTGELFSEIYTVYGDLKSKNNIEEIRIPLCNQDVADYVYNILR